MPTSVVILLGLHVPNPLPTSVFGLHMSWTHPAGRLIWATLLLLIGIAIGVGLMLRPRSPEPPTWAQCILGSIGLFALMILAYGSVPHEWVVFSSSYLHFSSDTFLLKQNSVIPFNIPRSAVADVITVSIYGVLVTTHLKMFAMWQQRRVVVADDAPGPRTRTTGTSAYGRPLTERG